MGEGYSLVIMYFIKGKTCLSKKKLTVTIFDDYTLSFFMPFFSDLMDVHLQVIFKPLKLLHAFKRDFSYWLKILGTRGSFVGMLILLSLN